ncbi:helix-turn-helix domain-containing protein [Roseomonas sp. OT10]|uniref:AraC-like ligand-binding domain-containing protein n=1 Tax=Roseomonas cutis TaxID=2897332 RepID=UPI001E3631E2|nr:helix-turn-helix domain-containing protein [Roseomonas sp. OT10]UFN50099.1 helix-turn-helix domain-containing protein [Roseomonas sp. OT10]
MRKPGSQSYCLRGLSSEILSSIFVPLEMRGAAAVEGRYLVTEVDSLRFIRARSRGDRYEARRRQDHIAAGAEGHCFVCLPLSRPTLLRQDGASCLLEPGDLGIVDSRREYSVEVPAGSDTLWLRLDTARLAGRFRAAPAIFARRIDGKAGIGRLAAGFLRSAIGQEGAVPLPSRTLVATVATDLLAEAAATLLQDRPFRSGSQRSFDRACLHIDRHADDPELSPASIARALGIGPRYLSQLFADRGETVMGRVQRQRLELCRARLEREVWRPGLITEFAYAAGFGNVSSFNRAFKAAFDRTPREVTLRQP